jgi:hypothetical protein
MAKGQHEHCTSLSFVYFFFDCYNSITDRYKGIFNNEGAGESDPFKVKWGWYIVIEGVAQGDVTRFQNILETNVFAFLNHVSYLKDKEQWQSKKA